MKKPFLTSSPKEEKTQKNPKEQNNLSLIKSFKLPIFNVEDYKRNTDSPS